MEVEPHRVAVDVGVEVEDVALDGDRVVFIQRRADTDVRHALEGAVEALEARRGDEDAAVGIELIERIDVDGGEADLAPQAAAGGDDAVDEVGAPEGEGHGAHGPARDSSADARAGDADAAYAHLVDALYGEAELLSRGLQLLEMPFASRAEGEVAADAHFRDLQRADEELFDEAVRRPARELVREGDDEERVDAHLPDQFFFLRQSEDLLRHAVGRDDGERMRVKGDDRRGPAGLSRARDDAADDGLMADVQAVEVADRGDAVAGEVRLAEWVVKNEHGARGAYSNRNVGTGTPIVSKSGGSLPSHCANRSEEH